MARSYKPAAPFNVAMKILVPTGERVQGALKKTFSAPNDSDQFNGSFRSFGGTENIEDGVYTVVDTAVIETWYRPDIKADCQIYVCETGQIYDIVATPEDIQMRHQYLRIKVKKAGGKA